MSDLDPQEVVDLAETQRDRAVEATANANPQADIDDVGDLYQLLTEADEMPTYTLELELHEYELVQLGDSMIQGLTQIQGADEVAFRCNMLAKLVEACPEHLERLDEIAGDADDPRGFA